MGYIDTILPALDILFLGQYPSCLFVVIYSICICTDVYHLIGIKSVIFIFFLDVNDDSVIHALKLIHPKLESQLLLAKQVALIGKLQKGK